MPGKTDPKALFRAKALNRLSSPDKLDELITVVGPKGWIAIIAIFALIVTLVFWGVFGSIAIKVKGQGILLRTGGLLKITSHVRGRVTDVAIVPGDFVRRGDVIARIEQPKLLSEIFIIREKSKDLELNLKKKFAHFSLLQKQYKKRQALLASRLKDRIFLNKKGLVTKQQLIDTTQQLQDVVTRINQLQIDRQKVADELDLNRHRLQTMMDELRRTSRITSSYTGYIIEVDVRLDSFVQAGTTIANIELEGKDIQHLEGVVYVSAAEGKKIKSGMSVTISPTTIKAEEFGSMRGKVTEVSPHAVTSLAMLTVLGNKELVKDMLRSGALFQVNVNLAKDRDTVSGFEWTSAKGPPSKIESGTLCTASLTVRTIRPISLVLPSLKKTLGV